MSRILAVNNYHYRRGGAETVYLDQMELFEARGWEVAAFSMEHPLNLPSAWSSHFAQQIELGQQSMLSRISDSLKIVYSTEAEARIRTLIRGFAPEIVHAHNIYHHLSPSVLAGAQKERVPVVMTLHDFKLLCPAYSMATGGRVCERCRPNAIHNVLVNRCLKGSIALSGLVLLESAVHRLMKMYSANVDCFIAPSRFLYDKFLEWGWKRESLAYIPHSIAAAHVTPRYAPGAAFLYFGRLAREKGIDTLIAASVDAQVPVWIVGRGPFENDLRAQAERLGADVRFFGFRSGESLWELVRAARAVVLPSVTYENAPVSILEAYAHGKPVIASELGGNTELVRVGSTGSLHAPGDVENLASHLVAMNSMSTPALADYGRQARDWVLSKFTPEKQFASLVALYARVRQQRHSTVPACEGD